MSVLLWIVRIYKWLLIAWVLMTWIPGVAGSSFHALLGLPIYPILKPFSFLHIGMVGLNAIIPLVLLNFLERWLAEQSGETARKEESKTVADFEGENHA